MHPCHPNSIIGCQFREIVKCFGTKPFVYPEAHALVAGPATLKKMEDYGWLVVTRRRVSVNGSRCNERRVVPVMKQWADEYEEEQRRKRLAEQQQAEETPEGDAQ